MKIEVEVNNLPKSAENYKYIVARLVDGGLWFYGAWNAEHYEKAKQAAGEFENGILLENGSGV